TGWAIHVSGTWNVNRTATFTLDKPAGFPGGTRWTIQLGQQYGGHHTLGRLRLGFGRQSGDDPPVGVRRPQRVERKFDEWLKQEEGKAVRWTVLRPVEAKSNLPLLTVLDDDSVLVSGDQTKRDVYDLLFRGDLRGVTALRLEVLPDDRLPKRGP